MAKVRGSWHLAAVKKPAAAAVLMDLKVQRITHGKCQSLEVVPLVSYHLPLMCGVRRMAVHASGVTHSWHHGQCLLKLY
jgi:hypothetical protein